MSGTARTGTGGLFDFTVGAYFSGTSSGLGVPFSQWESGTAPGGAPTAQDLDPTLDSAGGLRTSAEQGTAGTDTNTSWLGSPDLDVGGGFNQDWFEKVHLTPKAPIAFGNIITLVEDVYEIYSAFRNQEVTLTAITNNALPGVDLPDAVAPQALGRLSSFLRSTSTGNDGGVGLGTLANGGLDKTRIQALQEGLPQFDTNIVFGFALPAEDLELLISGSRIVLMPMVYEAPAVETLAFLTDIIESINGEEQRIALRKNPRQIFEVTYLLDANERQRMHALLLDWTDNAFGFPLWHERIFTTAAVSVGATAYAVSGAADCDFRVGGLAVIISNNYTYDVIEIQAITDTLITAADASVNGYPAGTAIMPLRTALIIRAASGARFLNNLESFNITFEVTDNDTGALAGSTTPGFWSIYNTRVLFDDPNIVEGSAMRTEYPRRIYRIDNGTGKVTQQSSWDRSKRGSEKGFVLRDREEMLQFRNLLSAIRGRQKAFYIPTFGEDLTVVANLVSGATTMDVEAHEYVRFIQDRAPSDLFRITFTDGTSLVRSVLSSATISSTVERLTLNTTWPANRTVAEVSRVMYYELCRFDADEIKIQHDRIGLARVNVPVLRVFDDN
jgi:hypothetical protein